VSAQRVVQAVRAIARDELEQRWHVALGLVTSVHGRNGQVQHACTVKLREPGLVLPKVPIAVGLLGFAALPAEGDLVVVAFAGGDLHAPVVVGRLYDEALEPPAHAPGELVLSLPGGEADDQKALALKIATPGDGTRTLTLTLAGEQTVQITIDDHSVQLQAEQASLKLSQSGGSDGRVELQAGDVKLVLDQGGDATLETTGKLTLKAKEVEISGDASIKIAGQTVEVN
jgi:uncharacterized protein involved in type VI secretion and phage assembly